MAVSRPLSWRPGRVETADSAAGLSASSRLAADPATEPRPLDGTVSAALRSQAQLPGGSQQEPVLLLRLSLNSRVRCCGKRNKRMFSARPKKLSCAPPTGRISSVRPPLLQRSRTGRATNRLDLDLSEQSRAAGTLLP